MTVVKIGRPLGQPALTPGSAGSLTICAPPTPPIHSAHSHYNYLWDASNAAAPAATPPGSGAGGSGREETGVQRSSRCDGNEGYNDDDGDDENDDGDNDGDDNKQCSPDSRRLKHQRSKSDNSSIGSNNLGTRTRDRDSSTASPTAYGQAQKKKQRRNKPTLSCFECVERKTKASEFLLRNLISPMPISVAPVPCSRHNFKVLGMLVAIGLVHFVFCNPIHWHISFWHCLPKYSTCLVLVCKSGCVLGANRVPPHRLPPRHFDYLLPLLSDTSP